MHLETERSSNCTISIDVFSRDVIARIILLIPCVQITHRLEDIDENHNELQKWLQKCCWIRLW